MANELMVLNEEFDPKMAMMMGQRAFDGEGWQDTLPQVKVNRAFEDAAGNSLPGGTFHVPTIDDEKVVTDYYGKTAEFRAFLNVFQIIHYDPEFRGPDGKVNGKYFNKTLKVRSYREEMRDELGGLRCGKLRYKEREGQAEDVLKEDAKRTNFRYVYGLIRMIDAVDRKGNKVELDWTPVVYRTSRMNMWTIGQALESIDKQGKYMLTHPVTLTLDRKVKGDNVYYHVVANVNFSTAMVPNQNDVDLLLKFNETVDHENTSIEAKYVKANKVEVGPEEAKLINDIEGEATPLEDDFKDEIPF